MVKKLRRENAVGKDEKAASGGKGFKGTKCAVVLTSALAVAGCAGDVTNEYNLPPIGQKSELCAEENVTLETQSKEVTVDVGQTFVFSNGYKMTLLDLEADTQTALFMLKDTDGNELRNVDMVEGVDYIIEFPEGNVMVAACSVRAGYTLGESSATVRSDADLTVEEEGPVDVVCESGLVIESWINMYNVASSAMQEVEDQSCDGVVVRELSVFDPAIETESDASGAVKGLPQGRYKVLVLGEDYILASVGPESVELAKEANLAPTGIETSLLTRLSRNSIWQGRYPVPASANQLNNMVIYNGRPFFTAFLAPQDIDHLNALIRRIKKLSVVKCLKKS